MDRGGFDIDGGVERRARLRRWNANIGDMEDKCENTERDESVSGD